MTRLRKLLVTGLMVIVTCCVSLGSALLSVTQSIFSWVKASANNTYNYANEKTNTTKEGDIVTVKNIPTSIKRYETINIPAKVFVTSVGDTLPDDASAVTPTRIDIKTPHGVSLLDESNTPIDAELVTLSNDGKYYQVKANEVGIYTVQYANKQNDAGNGKDVWTLSNIYEIEVTADSYAIEFTANNSIVMPDKIDTNQGSDTTVTLSLPLLHDANGKIIEKFILGDQSANEYFVAEYKKFENVWIDENNCPVQVEKDPVLAQGKNIYQEYWAYEITKQNENENLPVLIIEVKASGEETVSNSILKTPTEGKALKLSEEASLYNSDKAIYNNIAYTFKANSGKNIVTYKLYNTTNYMSATSPDAYVSRTIDGSTSYKKGDIELGVSVSANLKDAETSVEEKIYLPAVKAVNKNENKTVVNAHYSYIVKYIDSKNNKYDVSAETITMGSDDKGVYFVAHKEGDYIIYYNAVDFYGNTDKNADAYKYEVEVLDRTEPTVKYVNSYDYEDQDNTLVLDDYSYIIPKKYYIDENTPTEIAVPAVYVEDNFKDFDELELITRVLKSENAFINSENETKNFSMDIQNSVGNTDYDAKSDSKKIDVKNIIYFKNVIAKDYIIYNNNFYSKENFYITYSNDDTLEPDTKEIANISSLEDIDKLFEDYQYVTIKAKKLEGKDLIRAKSTQVAYIRLDSKLFGAGTYTIQYSVRDGKFENNTGNSFTFTLVKGTASNVDTKAPTVTFADSTIGKVVKDQKISVSKPEIQDEVDDKLLVKYYIVVGEHYLPIELDENNKLTFNTSDEIVISTDPSEVKKSIYDLAKETESKSFDIVALAYDDMSNYTDISEIADLTNPGNNIGVGIYNISIKYVEDALAPIIKSTVTDGVTEDEENKQFEDITVHGIKFYDDTNSAQISVKILDSNGVSYDYSEVDGYYCKLVDNSGMAGYIYEYNFPGVTFTANKADSYTVIYSIVDGGNNVTTYAYVIKSALDGEAPVISGLIGSVATIQLGQTYYLKNLEVSDNDDKTLSVEDLTFSVVGSDGKIRSSWLNGLEFTPKAVGKYTITMTVTDATNNSTTRSFVVEVKDTIKPTLELKDASTDNIIIAEDEKTDDNDTTVNWDEDVFPVVTIPSFSVKDEYQGTTGFNGIIGATGTISLTTPDDDVYIIDINGKIDGENPLDFKRVQNDDSSYSFTFRPIERGHYTASYVAEDKSGNKSEAQVIDIYIGDTERPNIYLSNSLLNILNKGFVIGENDELIIDPQAKVYKDSVPATDLYLKDNFGFNTTNDIVKVSVNVVNSNNNSIDKIDNDDNLIYYQFDKAGTYTITFTVTDSVGNVGTLSKTFKVSAKATSTSDAGKILGTVLIVVSVAILAGVVVYFVKGTKLLPKKNKKAKKQNNDKKED